MIPQSHSSFATLTPKKTKRITSGTEHINENHVSAVAAAISMVIAAILLVGAVVVLNILKQRKTQLGLIAMFTVLFAASVGILTNARRAEIFGSTAAYTAVLVVFISSTTTSGVGNCLCVQEG